MTPVDEIDVGFGHWFAGFCDGEGCFGIKRTNMGTYQCRFAIGLRADDEPILREIHKTLGIGTMCHSGKTNIHQEQFRWMVNSKADCVRLAAIFNRFPLRAKKANDLEIWCRALAVWTRVENGKRYDWHVLAEIAQELRDSRRYVPVAA